MSVSILLSNAEETKSVVTETAPDMSELTGFDKTSLKPTETTEKNIIPTIEEEIEEENAARGLVGGGPKSGNPEEIEKKSGNPEKIMEKSGNPEKICPKSGSPEKKCPKSGSPDPPPHPRRR